MADYTNLKQKAQEVRNEIKIGANTAGRVGYVLEETIKAVETEEQRARQAESQAQSDLTGKQDSLSLYTERTVKLDGEEQSWAGITADAIKLKNATNNATNISCSDDEVTATYSGDTVFDEVKMNDDGVQLQSVGIEGGETTSVSLQPDGTIALSANSISIEARSLNLTEAQIISNENIYTFPAEGGIIGLKSDIERKQDQLEHYKERRISLDGAATTIASIAADRINIQHTGGGTGISCLEDAVSAIHSGEDVYAEVRNGTEGISLHIYNNETGVSSGINLNPNGIVDIEGDAVKVNGVELKNTTIINDLTTGGADKALSAEMGKALGKELTELGSEVSLLEALSMISEPSYEKISGKYISGLGEVQSYDGWFYSSPIPLKKGETLLFSAVSYRNATISIYDNDTYKKVVEGVETSKQIYKYVASEDCEVVVSGEEEGALVALAMAEEKGCNVVNLCKNPFFDKKWILSGLGLSCIVNDGIVKATSSNASTVHRIEYTGTTLRAGETYFIYSEIKADKYSKVKIYTDEFSDEFDVYNSRHFKPVFWLVTPKENVTNIGIYVNDVYANKVGQSFEIRKPIIIDVKVCFNHDISVAPTIPSYEKVTGKYVSSLGEVQSYDGWFYSTPIRMNVGQKMVIDIKNPVGAWAIISKADFSPIVEAGSGRGNKYEYVASVAEDVVISGDINDMDVSIIDAIGAEYNYLKICRNWAKYDTPTSFYFNVDSEKRSYLVASLGSRYEGVADVVCYGENDQVEINRLIARCPSNTIYFADDSRYLLSAPILPTTGTSLISKGARFDMIDMVESVVTSTQESKYLSVDNINKYVKGMYLYCADDHQYNVVKEIFCSSNQIEIQIPKKYSDKYFIIKTASPAIYIRRKENVMIDGLSIDLNVANNPIQPSNPWYLQEGVTVDGSKRVTIQNCRICNGGRRGITTYDAIHFYLLNNYFNNWHEHSIDIFNSYTSNGNTTELPIMNHGVITGNVCENNKMSGIQCHRGSGCTIANNVIRNVLHGGIRCQEYAHDNSITGNVIENCVRGLYLNGFNISATGNTIKDSSHYGILVGERAGYVSIVANVIHNSIYCAIRLEANASYCNISDNLLENNNTIMDEESFSDDRAAVISIGNGNDKYGGNNHHNVIKCNYIVEEEPNTAKYAYVNINEDNTNNLFIRNIITGIAEDKVKAQETDVVRDNDFVV